MQRYFNSVIDKNGVAVVGASIRVLRENGAPATIYSDNGLTEQPNPTTSDASGMFGFYAADGTYSLEIAGARIGTKTIPGVQLDDRASNVDVSALAASTGASLVGWIRSGANAILRTVQSLFRERVSVLDTTGVTGVEADDQGAAINNAIADAASRGYCTLKFPDGTYSTSVTIVPLPGVTLKFAKNAIVKAIASMPALIQSPAGQTLFRVGIYGGYFDCNDLADVGLDIQWFQGYKVHHVEIQNYISVGARFGVSGTAFSSYEAMLHNLRAFRGAGTVAAGSIALHMRTATDARVSDCVLQGAETGIKTQAGGTYINCHAWVRSTTGSLQYGFDDQAGSAKFIGCYADTPHIAGFRLSYGNTALIGCGAFMNTLGGVDNTADGVLITSTVPNTSIVGFTCNGISSSFRFKTDINYAAVTDLSRVKFSGNSCNNVVTEAPSIVGATSPMEIAGASGALIGLRWRLNNILRWGMQTDASGNLVVQRRDGTGVVTDNPISINLSSGQVSMTAGGVSVKGTWDSPLTIGAASYWTNATSAKLYAKTVASGAPSSDTDGTVVGTQT